MDLFSADMMAAARLWSARLQARRKKSTSIASQSRPKRNWQSVGVSGVFMETLSGGCTPIT
eukprot:3205060-Rhodomonas_salina.3